MTDQYNHSSGKQDNLSDQAVREAERLKSEAKSAMDSATHKAKDQGRQAAQQAKERVGEQADKLANAERAAADQLREDDFPTLSHVADQMADGIHRFAGQVRNKNIDEIVHDIRDFGRRNPALLIVGSIAAGALLMRFAKASNRREPDELQHNESAREFGDADLHTSATELHTAVDEQRAPTLADSSANTFRPTSSTTPHQ